MTKLQFLERDEKGATCVRGIEEDVNCFMSVSRERVERCAQAPRNPGSAQGTGSRFPLRLFAQRRRFLITGLVAAIFAVLFSFQPAVAVEHVKTVQFFAETAANGLTIRDDVDFAVAIKPGTLHGDGSVIVEKTSDREFPILKGYQRVSDVYTVRVEPSLPVTEKPTLSLVFPTVGHAFLTSLARFDESTGWSPTISSINRAGTKVQAALNETAVTVAAFERTNVQEGVASYYGTYGKTTNLTLVAASNHFPRGQRVRVTNLDNGKSVTVKIVDTGAFRLPRVIDLSTPAFARIQPTWKGIARVRVEKATPWNAPPTAAEPAVASTAAASPPQSDGTDPQTTAAAASIVIDVASGQKLLGKRSGQPLPIASLTKVMTAAVVMDSKPDFSRRIAYEDSDKAEYCSCLNLKAGEEVTLKDLLYASLVGSANNATKTLVRATGMDKVSFVAKMNEKAKALNLNHTSFTEPTGLDAGNVASASDLAVLLKVIPDTYPDVAKALRTKQYEFTSANSICLDAFKRDGKCVHKIATTNKIMTDKRFGPVPYQMVASKTGFIDESRHTIMIRGRNASDREVIVVLLKTHRRDDSFAHANRLMRWTFDHYRWT